MRISELFDRALPYEWDQGPHYAVASAVDRQGATLDTVFTSNEDGMVDIEFQRGGSMATTGHGDEYMIFSTVIKAIREYMNTNPQVRIVYFSGDDDRIALYNRLADKLAAEFGFTKTLKGKRVFKLVRNPTP